ncbi:MAG: glycosyltransferase [Thermodesulfobacteriota bacterium]
MPDSFFNILMYSHDTYGLGHIRRTMAIANHLSDAATNILILTGSPIAGRFPFPQQVDFIRIPGMIKKTNDEYHSMSIRMAPEQALGIRKSIISAAARTFKPDLFIVDKEPLGLKREVLPTLEYLKSSTPACRTILGLRDILDDPATIKADWMAKDVYRRLETLYDEIWIYGEQSVYDPVDEYDFPKPIAQKSHFTGYIPRKKCSGSNRKKIRKRYRILDDDIFILVTTGGGGDGCEVLDHFVAMHEFYPTSLPFKSLVITGPFMPKEKRNAIKKRGRKYGIKTLPFHPRLEELMGAADLIVSMGGYNTVCEILSQQTPALIIPRETPRLEQLIRAEKLKEKGLIDYLPWKQVSAQQLRDKIFTILEEKEQYQTQMDEFPLTGLDWMRNRMSRYRRKP